MTKDICPCCGAHAPVDKSVQFGANDRQPPVEGDIGICWQCGIVLVFGDDLALRQAELADMNTWNMETKLLVADALKYYLQSHSPMGTHKDN